MKNTSPLVITISRQLGCGGALIGQQLAKALNVFYADREIISQAAKKFSVMEEDLKSCDEKKLSFWQSFLRSCANTPDTYVPSPKPLPSDLALFKTETEIITRIANERPSVIIGRCGSYILRDHVNRVSIFLHADMAFRTSRIQKRYDLPEEDAIKMIAQSDKERALYHKTITGHAWADARWYDLTLATDKTGIDQSLALILKYVEYFKAKH